MKRFLAILILLVAGNGWSQNQTISQQPRASTIVTGDDIVINATNSGLGTWTTKIINLGAFLASTAMSNGLVTTANLTPITNNFVLTNDTRGLSLTNTNNYAAASNFTAASTLNGNGRLVWNAGALTSPDDPNFSLFLNLLHGGVGNGTELQITFGQLYFGPVDGGHVQMGLGTHSNEFWEMHQAATPQSIATPTNFQGQSQWFGHAFTYAGTNGGGLGGWWWQHATNINNGTGESVWQLFAPAANKALNIGTTATAGPAELTAGANGLILPQNNFVQPFALGTTNTTNFLLNWTNAHAIEIDAVANVNIIETNQANATNVLMNNFALERDIFLVADTNSHNCTVPNNWVWVNATSNVLAQQIFQLTADTVVRLHLWETLGTKTNTYFTLDYGLNYDPDALNFINTAGITTPAQQIAVNNLVVNMKADGTWAQMDAIYPFVGGTSSTESFNLKNPATFQITWHGTVTFNANGITGDGSTGYGDPSYTPSTSGVNFALNSASMSLYLKTAGLSSGDLSSGFGTTGAQRFGIQNGSSANLWSFAGLNNATTGNGALTASPTTGFVCATRTAANSSTMYFGTQTSGDGTASGALCNSHIGILCRLDGGPTPDHFSAANLAFYALGAGLNSSQEALLKADVVAFETTLSRQ